MYSNIAEREAVYEELPFTAGNDLVNGQAKVHSSDNGSLAREPAQQMETNTKAEQVHRNYVV